MKKLLMLGTSSASVQMLEYARAQGMYTIVTDYLEPEQSAGKQISDEYWMISTGDLDVLEKKCREEGITAVISGISDFNVSQAVALNHRLGLPCYCDPEVWKYSRNKSLFKEKCREYGVPTARQYFVSQEPAEAEIDQIQFPVIVKPTDCSANRGFGYCYAREDFLPALKTARDTSPSGMVVIEKMLRGKEYAAYYAMSGGEVRLVNFWSMRAQPGMPENCYSISTTVTDQLHHYLETVNPRVEALLKGLGYRDGIVWLEFMADEDGSLNALEIAHRLSGELLWLPLREVTGFDSIKWLVDYAYNSKNDIRDLPPEQTDYPDRTACAYILWTNHAGTVGRISGLEQWRSREDFVVSSLIHEGSEVGQYRYGIILAFHSENTEEMIRTIRQINDTVQVLDTEGRDMIIRYDDFEALRMLDAAEN